MASRRQFSYVFPAYAGVFHKRGNSSHGKGSLPRIRGGVSQPIRLKPLGLASSPHTWGCFLSNPERQHCKLVFPAYAGVFLPAHSSEGHEMRLPRIRGGVSCLSVWISSLAPSSPHTRGCFSQFQFAIRSSWVFPAYAWVFPGLVSYRENPASLPRIRVGVSCA